MEAFIFQTKVTPKITRSKSKNISMDYFTFNQGSPQ